MRICQLLNLGIFIFLASCSTPEVIAHHEEQLITAGWLKVPFRFEFRDQNDSYLTHPFFDVEPGFIKDKRAINFFITTQEGSSYKYNLDLYSGRLYKDRNYCPVEDVWESYKKDVEKPNFTQGIVPRTYDENSNPQKIIIFGNKLALDKFKYQPTSFDSARIIGSVLLDACENYPCDRKEKWKSSQILVAIAKRDPLMKKINFVEDLKRVVDWNYAKAILVNQDGGHHLGNKIYPAFRISKEFNLDETMKYFEKNSTTVKLDELSKWRDSCFKMYDDIWTNSEKIRAEKSGGQTSFLKYFKEFYSKNSNEFYNCQKLVRVANINEDPKRFWFFTYLQAFSNLEKNGFFYSCTENAWSYNPKVDDGHYFNNQMKELDRCRARDFEKSFDQAINGLSMMKNQINRNFKFIEYDSGHGGSHQKIYAWLPEEGRVSVCKNKNNAEKDGQFDLFPQDVIWQNFSPESEKLIK